VVATLSQPQPPRRNGGRRARSQGSGDPSADRPLRKASAILRESLTARPVERQSPLLADLHRVTSGALLGLGLSTLAFGGLTVYWQNQWAVSFQRLEASKSLEHRLQQSAAVLEQHHLGVAGRPGLLVPTRSEQLIHLAAPGDSAVLRPGFLARLRMGPVPAGY
jgi:hypothetical protein